MGDFLFLIAFADDGFEVSDLLRLPQKHIDEANGNNGFSTMGFGAGNENSFTHNSLLQ